MMRKGGAEQNSISGLAELGRVRRHRVVAGHREIAAAAEAIAVNRSHNRKTRAPDTQPGLVTVLGVVTPVLHGRARLFSRRDVEAGAEGLAGTGDDHRPDGVVALASVHRRPEVREQLIGQGVHFSGRFSVRIASAPSCSSFIVA